jgi:hypothetical protein
MTNNGTLAERVRHELREYAIVATYLYVCFGVLLLYRYALLREDDVSYVHLGMAAGKALILGKFMMLGEAAKVGSRLQARNLLIHIMRKVLLFLALLIALTALEEILAGMIHGRSVTQVVAGFEARSALELLATCLYMLLVLTPYIAIREISAALGVGVLRRVLLGPPGNASASNPTVPA